MTCTPIQDTPFGPHLNFRDPDNIPLEFYVPNQVVTDAFTELLERRPSRKEIAARVRQATAAAAASTPPERGLP